LFFARVPFDCGERDVRGERRVRHFSRPLGPRGEVERVTPKTRSNASISRTSTRAPGRAGCSRQCGGLLFQSRHLHPQVVGMQAI